MTRERDSHRVVPLTSSSSPPSPSEEPPSEPPKRRLGAFSSSPPSGAGAGSAVHAPLANRPFAGTVCVILSAVASDASSSRANRWREFLTGRFYGAFQEDVVPVRFARDARNAMDPLTDPLAAGANEDSRERTNRVATAERRKKTTNDVPANGRFADGAWIDDGAENGDDVGGSPSFGSSASSASSASSDGQGGDGDEPLGTAR